MEICAKASAKDNSRQMQRSILSATLYDPSLCVGIKQRYLPFSLS